MEIAKIASLKYLDSSERLPVYPTDDALSLLALFDEHLPDTQTNTKDLDTAIEALTSALHFTKHTDKVNQAERT